MVHIQCFARSDSDTRTFVRLRRLLKRSTGFGVKVYLDPEDDILVLFALGLDIFLVPCIWQPLVLFLCRLRSSSFWDFSVHIQCFVWLDSKYMYIRQFTQALDSGHICPRAGGPRMRRQRWLPREHSHCFEASTWHTACDGSDYDGTARTSFIGSSCTSVRSGPREFPLCLC